MPPSGNIFYIRNGETSTCNCSFNFNFLGLVVSEILWAPKFTLHAPSGKNLTYAQVVAHTYITVKFQLRSSINVRLTENSLYNRFCIERSPKWGFWGQERRYLVGTPYECNDSWTTSLGEKIFGDALNTVVCMCSKEITKKDKIKGMSTPWGLHFTPVQCLPP